MEAFVGMQVLPAITETLTTKKSVTTMKVLLLDRQTPDKVIHMCRYALQEPQMWSLFAI